MKQNFLYSNLFNFSRESLINVFFSWVHFKKLQIFTLLAVLLPATISGVDFFELVLIVIGVLLIVFLFSYSNSNYLPDGFLILLNLLSFVLIIVFIFASLNLIPVLLIVVPLLISVAYFTLAERKILGAIQRRRGPNVMGAYGLLQPLSDGLKLLVKETILPSSANRLLFIISPILTFVISLVGWAIIPYDKFAIFAEMNIGILYLFAVSSLGVYGVIMSGWSSNSKYAFLGALRSTAQMVSYEVSIGFIMITIVVCCGSFNLQTIIECQKNVWFVIPFLPLFLMFFTSALAETNRHPFDLPEAEAELVSGYNVEYSAMGFALFSLGEYSNMLMMSSINVILFFGGWLSPIAFLSFIPGSFWFGLKICFFVILFVWIRAALPRYRYDQLMGLGWKVFLPISLSYLMLTFSTLLSFNLLPY